MLDKFKIGHWTDQEKGTGVSVILCEEGAIAGGSIQGAAPATRETDLLRVDKTVQKINAVTLSGGSAFGLEASCGVMQYLYEQSFGYDTGAYKVPIVVGASLYDLEYKSFAYPNKDDGYMAAKNAKAENFEAGNIGAGTGATVGKIFKMKGCMKGGLGVQTYKEDNLEIAVFVAVNALGDIIDQNKKIIAGAKLGKKHFAGSAKYYNLFAKTFKKMNTTISCIITNAKLNKEQANAIADIAHKGYDLAIKPSHTVFDGDAVFCMASAEVKTDFEKLKTIIPELVSQSIRSIF